ncbi:MAG: hypothetical protein AAFQ50_04075 [Pseudomonadota bacterium]
MKSITTMTKVAASKAMAATGAVGTWSHIRSRVPIGSWTNCPTAPTVRRITSTAPP